MPPLPATARRPVLGPQREAEVPATVHPDHLRIGIRRLRLVDDELTRRIQTGYPTLGWEGDARMALYIDARGGEWVLVRLEHDGVYRITTTTDPVALALAPIDVIGQLVAWLVDHDGRRGFDPLVAAMSANADRAARLDADFDDEMANDIAPRLRHALKRDLGAHA